MKIFSRMYRVVRQFFCRHRMVMRLGSTEYVYFECLRCGKCQPSRRVRLIIYCGTELARLRQRAGKLKTK